MYKITPNEKLSMAKRASTHESLVLAFEMLKRIPRSYKITANELHEQLSLVGIDRDIRTIQRNLEMLSEHFDIEKDDRSKPYGYSWIKASEGLSMPNLTSQESLLLSLAEDYLSNLLPANVMASLDGFFGEARYNLKLSSGSSKEGEWLKKVRVVSETQPLLPPKVDTEVFKNISEALFNDRLLNIEYTNGRQEKRSAMVMPLGLAQQGVRLYFVCRFDGYDNERSLAVHRIQKAVISTFEFERPKNFSLTQYDADGRFGFGEGEKCEIEFTITKQAGYHLLETPLSEDQEMEEVDKTHYRIKATVTDSLLVRRWLLSFGEEIKNITLGQQRLLLSS